MAVALGFLVGSPGVAHAKTTITPGYTYISDQDCTWTQAGLTDAFGEASLHLQSVGTTDWWGGGGACTDTSRTVPAWQLAVKQNVMRWTNGAWQICNTNASWVYNTGGPAHAVWTAYGWAFAPCGPGYYRSWSTSAAVGPGGWHGQDISIWGNDWVIGNP